MERKNLTEVGNKWESTETGGKVDMGDKLGRRDKQQTNEQVGLVGLVRRQVEDLGNEWETSG